MNTITLSALDLSTKSMNESREEKTLQYLKNPKNKDQDEVEDDPNEFEEDDDDDNTHIYEISDMSNERLKE